MLTNLIAERFCTSGCQLKATFGAQRWLLQLRSKQQSAAREERTESVWRSSGKRQHKFVFVCVCVCFAGGWSPAEGAGHLREHVCPDILQDVAHVGIFQHVTPIWPQRRAFSSCGICSYLFSCVWAGILKIKHSFYMTCHTIICLFLVLDLILEMSSVKHCGTRRLAPLGSGDGWSWSLWLLILFICFRFSWARYKMWVGICVSHFCKRVSRMSDRPEYLEQLRQSSLKPEGRNQGCTQA